MPSTEQLFGAHLRGAVQTRTGAEETHPWANRTTIDSGSTSVTVSTALVNSDSIIRLTTEVGSIDTAIQSAGHIVVNSIVSGVSFALAWALGTSVAFDNTVMWELVKTT